MRIACQRRYAIAVAATTIRTERALQVASAALDHSGGDVAVRSM
jgi:hypothetical protein